MRNIWIVTHYSKRKKLGNLEPKFLMNNEDFGCDILNVKEFENDSSASMYIYHK